LYTTDSHPTLARYYDEMMRSSAFEELDAAVTAQQPIRLIGTTGPGGVYDHAEHSISLPVSVPAAEARRLLLFEMHNAHRRGEINRIDETFSARITSLSEQPRYRTAARALAVEWEEWISVAEAHIRGALIDNDLGGGGDHVDQSYAARYDTPDEKWFNFEDYLADQRKTHTRRYDRAAERPGWAGEEILEIVRSDGSAPLRITQEDISEFRAGRRSQITNNAKNPFGNLEIVARASERWTSSPTQPAPTATPPRKRRWWSRLIPSFAR
jgi:hypothetical protein